MRNRKGLGRGRFEILEVHHRWSMGERVKVVVLYRLRGGRRSLATRLRDRCSEPDSRNSLSPRHRRIRSRNRSEIPRTALVARLPPF